MQDFLNDKEKTELEKLTENAVLLSALKKIFLADIYQNGSLDKEPMGDDYRRNFAFSLSFNERGEEYGRSNEDLGKALRACNEALRMISVSFDKINKYKKIIEIDVSQPAKHR